MASIELEIYFRLWF